MKSFITAVALTFVLSAGSIVDSIDVGGSGWLDLKVNMNEADARGRGGPRGGSGSRRSAHTSTHRSTHTRTSRSSKNINVNKNVNVNRNVNVDHRHRRRAPVGAAVAGAVVGGLVVGAIVSSLPPSCSTVFVDGISYHRCDGIYYEPSYRGTDVVYVIVDDPY